MHDAITVGIPVVAILLGILLNQRGLDRLGSRLDKLETKIETLLTRMDSRIDRIQADLAQFNSTLAPTLGP